jgi:hypothetical protein
MVSRESLNAITRELSRLGVLRVHQGSIGVEAKVNGDQVVLSDDRHSISGYDDEVLSKLKNITDPNDLWLGLESGKLLD